MEFSADCIETVPAEELAHIPNSTFALARVTTADTQDLAGVQNGDLFTVATWTSAHAAEAARVLLPDAKTWEVVGLLFTFEDDSDLVDATVSAERA